LLFILNPDSHIKITSFDSLNSTFSLAKDMFQFLDKKKYEEKFKEIASNFIKNLIISDLDSQEHFTLFINTDNTISPLYNILIQLLTNLEKKDFDLFKKVFNIVDIKKFTEQQQRLLEKYKTLFEPENKDMIASRNIKDLEKKISDKNIPKEDKIKVLKE
jgi:hypothetical protein